MRYRQITFEERYTLSLLRRLGLAPAAIARILGRHRSTILREVQRGERRHVQPPAGRLVRERPAVVVPAQSPVYRGRAATRARAARGAVESGTDRRLAAALGYAH